MNTFTNLKTIETLTGPQLRNAIKEEINAGELRPITVGLLLYRIRRELWFSEWGHRNISDYCHHELSFPMSVGIKLISIAQRCRSLDMSYAEMQTVEKLVKNSWRLLGITRYARSKRDLVKIARVAARLPWSQVKKLLKVTTYNPLHATQIGTKPIDFDTVYRVHDWVRGKLRRQGKALLIPFLVVQAIRESKPGRRRRKLQMLLMHHDIDGRFIPEIFKEGE